MIPIELLELYYKKYTASVQAADYIDWAYHHLYLEIFEIKKLASMDRQGNIFEIEKMFANAMADLQREVPSKEECVDFHIKLLHSQLLASVENTMLIVKEIYDCTIEFDLFEVQMNWQEISDMIDDFQYGDNQNHYTKNQVEELIVTHARRLWHTKINCKELLGQKITGITSDPHI